MFLSVSEHMKYQGTSVAVTLLTLIQQNPPDRSVTAVETLLWYRHRLVYRDKIAIMKMQNPSEHHVN